MLYSFKDVHCTCACMIEVLDCNFILLTTAFKLNLICSLMSLLLVVAVAVWASELW